MENQNPSVQPTPPPSAPQNPATPPLQTPMQPQVTPAPVQAPVNQPQAVPPQAAPTMVSTPSVPPPTGSIYPQATMGIGASPGMPASKSDFEQLDKKGGKSKLIILAAVPLVLIIALGVTMFLNANIRDLVLMKKYREFSYSNSGADYTLSYYKGSKVEQNPLITSTDNLIVSPAFANGALPIGLSVERENTPTAVPSSVSSCTLSGFTKAFSVYVPFAASNVNFCSYSAEGVTDLIYVGEVKHGSDNYTIAAAQVYDKTKATTDKTYARQVLGKLGLSPFKNDLKQYIGTIKLD